VFFIFVKKLFGTIFFFDEVDHSLLNSLLKKKQKRQDLHEDIGEIFTGKKEESLENNK
jgi:hypothetical protein